MNKIVIITLSALLVMSALASTSAAQTPFIAIYFDQDLETMAVRCPNQLPGSYDTWYVVAHNFNANIEAVEYKIDYPSFILHMNDLLPAGATSEGTSPWGVVISFSSPLNGYEPQLVQSSLIQWYCSRCGNLLQVPVRPLPHPTSGRLGAVRSSDGGFIDAIGWTSIICPHISPNKNSTWGHIKILYD